MPRVTALGRTPQKELHDWFKPRSFDLMRVKRETHREDGKNAKNVDEPPHSRLTMNMVSTASSAIRSIPSLVELIASPLRALPVLYVPKAASLTKLAVVS
jgi:hypothetical protein